MQYVYAFEWCSCVYESGFSIESLHSTKVGAYKAMRKALQERWIDEFNLLCRGPYRIDNCKPLESRLWRVRKIEVFE